MSAGSSRAATVPMHRRPAGHAENKLGLVTRSKSSAQASSFRPTGRGKPTPPPSDIYTASAIPPRARNLEPRRAGISPGHLPILLRCDSAGLVPFCPSVPPSLFLHRGGGRSAGVRGSGVRSLSPTPLATGFFLWTAAVVS